MTGIANLAHNMGDDIIQTVAVQRVKDGIYSAAPFGRRAIFGNMRPIASVHSQSVDFRLNK